MRLTPENIARVHRREITPAEAFALQGAAGGADALPAFPGDALPGDVPQALGLPASCAEAKAAVEAVRPDIAANGPDALRDLLAQTDALLERQTGWTKCQRAARYRAILAAYRAARDQLPVGSLVPATGRRPMGTCVPFDLVVPLGTGSTHSDLELRFLLRSAFANLPSVASESMSPMSPMSPMNPMGGLRLIHIIGPRRPKWLRDCPMLRWHQWKPIRPKNHDIIAKFLHAANHPDVAEHFLASCDDFLFLRPLDVGCSALDVERSGSPPATGYAAIQRGGVLSSHLDQGYWKRAQAETRRLLDSAGKPFLFYDYHVPTLMTKAGWRLVDRTIAWRSVPGHAVWSLYHNVAGTHGPVLGKEHNASGGYHAGDGTRAPSTPEDIDTLAQGKLFLNYNDGGLRGGVLQTWLGARFPDPAPWEIGCQSPQFGRSPHDPPIPSPVHPPGLALTAEHALGSAPASDPLPHITVVTVLKSGGRYRVEHVEWQRQQVATHLRNPHRFVCLTDIQGVPGGLPFPSRLPQHGWFAKLDLFADDLWDADETVLYTDLDNVWLRDVELQGIPAGSFWMHDARQRRERAYSRWVSGLMLWRGVFPLRRYWARLPVEASAHFGGDQEMIVAALLAQGTEPRGIDAFVQTRGKSADDQPFEAPLDVDIMHFWRRPKPWDSQCAWASGHVGHSSRTALVFTVYGADAARLHAARVGLARTASVLGRMPAAILVEGVVTGGDSQFAAQCAELGVVHVQVAVPDARFWIKEWLLRHAVEWLSLHRPGTRYAVQLDADASPTSSDWIDRMTKHWLAGEVAFQPWDTFADRLPDGRTAGTHRSRCSGGGWPGLCWAVDLDWLRQAGGFPTEMVVGGGDTMMVDSWLTGSTSINQAWYKAALARYGLHRIRSPQPMRETLVHEWHGARGDRHYRLRYDALSLACRDPRELYAETDGLPVLRDTVFATAWSAMSADRKRWRKGGMSALWTGILRATWPTGAVRLCEADDVSRRDSYFRSRWEYYEVAIGFCPAGRADVLEVGPRGFPLFSTGRTMDLPGMAADIHHDATNVPWPEAVGRPQVVMALEVLEHLGPGAAAAAREMLRVATVAVIVSIPYLWPRGSEAGHAELDDEALAAWFGRSPDIRRVVGTGKFRRLVARFDVRAVQRRGGITKIV